MQTCSKCHTQAPDSALYCPQCQSDLKEFSDTSTALKTFKQNPRVSSVRISTADDACPACRQLQGNYPKDTPPTLPVQGCSHEKGCRCFYEPVLEEIFP